MKLDTLLYARDDCIATCPEPAPCSCGANESCVQIGRSCHACPAPQCIPNSTPTTSSGGISSGAVAGAVVAALVALAVAGFFVWWYRRRNLRNKAAAKETPKEAPARAEDVLNRPDPNEKPEVDQNSLRARSTVSYSGNNPNALQIIGQAIGSPLHSPTRDSMRSNPFGDAHSIQTTSTSTQGTNVIPIALVAPGSVHSSGSPMPSSQHNPLRPDRTPELDLNLDHVNVSREGTRTNTPQSQVSGAGSEVSNRNSYLSSMSYASDFLNEVPVIVNTRRQVVGVVKAEVMQSPTNSSHSSDSLKVPASARTAARSPLAGSSFGPADILKEEEEQDVSVRRDPFDDTNEHTPTAPPSPIRPSNASGISEFSALEPPTPWARSDDDSRPTSISTQAGSIIADIGSATRVQVGLRQVSPGCVSPAATPVTADSFRSQHRMTSARLVSPPSRVGPLEQQQQRALMSARQQHRDSSASGFSTASTKADSILESFPFVPPSPISDRPVRTGPRSPSKPQFSPNPESSSTPPSPLPAPPDRRALGMSTGSQISTMSAGLGAFPFQIDSGHQSTASAPTSVDGRQRASLDTLALTSDLSSYPLGFDKELRENYPLRKI